ncbi:DUF2252 domain-containing protein [Tumidithrix helvetica PCC 7403]|uniref:DUF2252 domain-containing protein n=1 Tax=Tumidithrix helvetica TaxID=3457545 RepID=UPI003CC26022
MAKRNICDRIQSFNLSQNRDCTLLAQKYEAMRSDAFVFLRGTCHLFYQDLPVKSWFKKAPLVWICGDLHIENFGSYKSDRRNLYFDINDFDEAILAPCTWEVSRFLTSIFVAASSVNIREQDAELLCQQFLAAYTKALATGKAYWVGKDTAEGMVASLLERKNQEKRIDLLERRTEVIKGQRKIKNDPKRSLPISAAQQKKLEKWMEAFARKQANPQFFNLLDAAQRIAGTGSLGIERYILLVEGNGSPDLNYLLDLKASVSSALQPYAVWEQPIWGTEAERVFGVQTRMQAVPIAFLDAVAIDGKSYILRELQSTQSPTDRLKLEKWDDKLKEVGELMESLGQTVAWAQLRSGGRQYSAIADQLIDFAGIDKWRDTLLTYAREYSHQVQADWQEFKKGCDRLLEDLKRL